MLAQHSLSEDIVSLLHQEADRNNMEAVAWTANRFSMFVASNTGVASLSANTIRRQFGDYVRATAAPSLLPPLETAQDLEITVAVVRTDVHRQGNG
jgi:hypothetical protein